MLGENLFIAEDYALHCSSPDEQMGQSKHGALVFCLCGATLLRSNGKANPGAAPVLRGPQIWLSWVPVQGTPLREHLGPLKCEVVPR